LLLQLVVSGGPSKIPNRRLRSRIDLHAIGRYAKLAPTYCTSRVERDVAVCVGVMEAKDLIGAEDLLGGDHASRSGVEEMDRNRDGAYDVLVGFPRPATTARDGLQRPGQTGAAAVQCGRSLRERSHRSPREAPTEVTVLCFTNQGALVTATPASGDVIVIWKRPARLATRIKISKHLLSKRDVRAEPS
jgi:hypothetical protein